MKKFYTLLATALVAVSASAQVYFVGDFQGWAPATPTEATKAEDGSWVVEIQNVPSFKMSTAFGSWDEFNAGALMIEGADNVENLGKELKTAPGDKDIVLPYLGDYKIVISADYSTAVITTNTPPPTGPVSLYLRGGMNDWGAPDLWKMSSEDGVTYWFDCQGETKIPAGTEFKIADANWAKYDFGAGDEIIPFEEPIQWFHKGANGVMTEEYEGTIKFVLVDDTTADVTAFPTIVDHVAGVADITVSENEAAEYFNLQGIRVAAPENGLFIRRRGNTVTKVLVK